MKVILPDFKNNKLVPTIIQEFKSKDVLMLGFNNEESYINTVNTGWVWLWSRKRKKLWQKGESSGNKLMVKNISVDCDLDTILITVKLIGRNVCHRGNKTCFTKI